MLQRLVLGCFAEVEPLESRLTPKGSALSAQGLHSGERAPRGFPEPLFIANKKATLLGWLSRLNLWLSSSEESGIG